MKFLNSFIRIDTTIPDDLWANGSALSCVCHEYVSTERTIIKIAVIPAKSKQPSSPRRIMQTMVKVCFALKAKLNHFGSSQYMMRLMLPVPSVFD
jgi:hypothetical protein